MSRLRRLAILGTHAYAEEVAALAEDSGVFEVTHFVENLDRERCRERFLGREVLWVNDLPQLRETHEVLCAIGTTRRARFTAAAEALGMRFATLIHPSARVLPRAEIGEGCILGLGVLVGTRAVLGRHGILNRGVTIGHHTLLGSHVTVCPGSHVAGRVVIGDRVYLGMGSLVLDGVRIGTEATVGAGSVVTREIPPRTLVLGYPAAVVRTDMEPT